MQENNTNMNCVIITIDNKVTQNINHSKVFSDAYRKIFDNKYCQEGKDPTNEQINKLKNKVILRYDECTKKSGNTCIITDKNGNETKGFGLFNQERSNTIVNLMKRNAHDEKGTRSVGCDDALRKLQE